MDKHKNDLKNLSFRSSHRWCSIKRGAPTNFLHLSRNLFFNNVAGLRPSFLLQALDQAKDTSLFL